MSSRRTRPCQPSRSSSTKSIHGGLVAAGLPVGVRAAEPVAGREVKRFQVGPLGGEHGDGQERAADVDQLQPLDVRLAPRAGEPGSRGMTETAPCGAHRIASRCGHGEDDRDREGVRRDLGVAGGNPGELAVAPGGRGCSSFFCQFSRSRRHWAISRSSPRASTTLNSASSSVSLSVSAFCQRRREAGGAGGDRLAFGFLAGGELGRAARRAARPCGARSR